MIQEIVAPKACTHFPYNFWNGEYVYFDCLQKSEESWEKYARIYIVRAFVKFGPDQKLEVWRYIKHSSQHQDSVKNCSCVCDFSQRESDWIKIVLYIH